MTTASRPASTATHGGSLTPDPEPFRLDGVHDVWGWVMVEPLRLMTFNVQLLPVIAGLFEGTVSVPQFLIGLFPKGAHDSIERAEAVAADLLAIPAPERPHVIGLNEVFSEDGRKVLLKRLAPVWPHVVESVHEGDLEEDAGLMVFSRIPFQPLPDGGDRAELFYTTDAGDDSWASKAAVLVQVDLPAERTTLVFTHLQASYLGDDQHRGVREAQLRELVDWLDGFFDHDPGKWANLVVAGDLNVRGDPAMTTDEWFDVFDRPGHPFGDRFTDTWIEMRPPGATTDHDPGLTNRDRSTGERRRLDYLCRVKPVDHPQVVAHHARVGHRHVSDHFALEGLFQLRDAHCQPSTAVDILASAPISAHGPSQPRTSAVRVTPVALNEEGARHWTWIERAGTYTFHTDPGLRLEVYADTDISTPLRRIDELSISELPPALQTPYHRHREGVDPKGSTYASRSPLLVAVHHAHKTFHGQLFVLEHLGDSPETAITLPPHLDVEVPFPANQRLGDDDIAYFRIRPRPTLVGGKRDEAVTLDLAGHSGTLTAVDRSLSPIGSPASGSATIEHVFTVETPDEFYVTVERDRDDAVGQVIRWNTPVTYLRLGDGFTIHVNDETGPDWPGADEPELTLTLDSDSTPLLHTVWNDADTGEDWPGLVDKLRFAALQRGWTEPSIAFAQAIGFELIEPDPPLGMAHGVVTHEIKPLVPNEPSPRRRSMAVTVFDTVSNGTYTVSCSLSRDP